MLKNFTSYKYYFIFLIKWLFICLVVGALAGSASAFFLISLELATHWRGEHQWIIWFLPLGGLIIGLSYHYWGKDVVKGNNQLIEEFNSPKKIIPFIMAPLVLFGTVATHFFGGSAGREGTAVQMGGSIADQLTKYLKLNNIDRKIILVTGVSAGFASVFGTPLAGAVFALEVFIIGRMRYEALIPSLLAAVVAHYVCLAWGVGHTHYHIPFVNELTLINILWAILAGIFFGLAGILFSKGVHLWGNLFKSKINYPPLRPMIGGIILAIVFWIIGTRYAGLGVPIIVESFEHHVLPYDFALKILFTTFTLGVGFKGGEVTPLFFIGATLGNVLSFFIPLHFALLAGMGFVAVFGAASNTPIACTLMGIELFGIEAGIFIAIACFVAYLFSGHTGIYGAQIIGSAKGAHLNDHKGKILSGLK